MGPRSRERGHVRDLDAGRGNLAQLQWGRAHVSADIIRPDD